MEKQEKSKVKIKEQKCSFLFSKKLLFFVDMSQKVTYYKDITKRNGGIEMNRVSLRQSVELMGQLEKIESMVLNLSMDISGSKLSYEESKKKLDALEKILEDYENEY
jgi:hypothetical protein